ncbi:MAG: hypothetical protein IJA73_03070 [Oscillospiraceae bacterium]|nr:hypothetical protein [Oscillospiraceae bacterium]
MVYYADGKELEVISTVFCGSVNDAYICRNRTSASGALYTLLVVRDRECAKKMLLLCGTDGAGAWLWHFAQNEELIFVFPFREERKFSAFARGQAVSAEVAENICVNLVMECLSADLPWPLLYLVLEQDGVQIAKDNTVYFTMCLDLAALDTERTERNCVSSCARLMMELLGGAGAPRKRSRVRSFELIAKKSAKNAYGAFPELYRDIKLTAIPEERATLLDRARGAWRRNRDRLFRVLLVLCGVLAAIALAALATQMIYGEIPWLRVFQNTFDVIGTENLHTGGHI